MKSPTNISNVSLDSLWGCEDIHRLAWLVLHGSCKQQLLQAGSVWTTGAQTQWQPVRTLPDVSSQQCLSSLLPDLLVLSYGHCHAWQHKLIWDQGRLVFLVSPQWQQQQQHNNYTASRSNQLPGRNHRNVIIKGVSIRLWNYCDLRGLLLWSEGPFPVVVILFLWREQPLPCSLWLLLQLHNHLNWRWWNSLLELSRSLWPRS